MILNYPNGNPFKFLFLNRGMADTLSSQSIPWDALTKLSVYHGVLTYGEMAGFLKTQELVAKRFGVTIPDLFATVGGAFEVGMVSDAFNSMDSEALALQLKNATHFQYVVKGQTIIMVAGEHQDSLIAGFSKLSGRNLSAALLETIYKQAGYLETHSGEILLPAVGEFTVAEVLKLLSIENP